MLDLQAVRRFMVNGSGFRGRNWMAESDANEADALSRLEAALDRIARHQARPAVAPVVPTALLASRMDRLIGQLRHALADEA